MSNAIVVWSGTLASIPSRWYLCDGTNGTPALDVKYIRGAYAAGTRPAGTEVGTLGHTHTLGNSSDDVHTHTLATAGDHAHAVGAGTDLYSAGADRDLAGSGNHQHTTASGTIAAHTHAQTSSDTYNPPYYMLGYIMYFVEGIMPEAPVNAICTWTGSEADVPTDWAYCDGTGGTPDLRDKFLYGYRAGTNVVGDTGGASTHTHALTNAGTHLYTATIASGGTNHTHTLSASGVGGSTGVVGGDPSDDLAVGSTDAAHDHTGAIATSGNHAHTVTTETFLERYYTLAYLMKVS